MASKRVVGLGLGRGKRAKEKEKEKGKERRKCVFIPGINDLLDSFRYTGSTSSSRGGGGGVHFNFKTSIISQRGIYSETKNPINATDSFPSPSPSPLNRTRPTALDAALNKAKAKKPCQLPKQPHSLNKHPTKSRKQPKATATATVTVKRRTTKPKSTQLKKADKRLEAYRRVPHDFNFKPPRSRHHLIQEDHSFDHWRVLIICMFLNMTSGKQVKNVIEDFFAICPDAETTTKVDAQQIENVIHSLGLQNKRANMIKRLSEEYLRPDWTHVTSLHGIGKYGADAYAIFCTGKGADVRPDDHKLVDYWNSIYGNDTRSDAAV